ncbi:hypothetical protein [Bradyrhizobium sp. USDA 4471]
MLLLKRWGANLEFSPFSALPIDDLENEYFAETEEIDDEAAYQEFLTACISNWFLENFEVPEPGSTYDEYVWGGPFDAREAITTMFSDTHYLNDGLIDAVVDRIELQGTEWVPRGSRLVGLTKEEAPRSAEEAYKRMQEHLRALKELLVQAPEVPTGIGHNRPPEPIDDTPLEPDDSAQLAKAIEVLETQPVAVIDKGASALEASAVIDSKRKKIAGWLARQGDSFASEAVKEAGKQFGRWMPRAFWLLIIERMIGVTDMLAHWLSLIAPHGS